MKPTYEELEQQVLELSVQLANAESKCRELAAENGELKSYRPRPGGQVMMEALDAFESQDDYPEGGMMDAFELLCCKHVETPATDAFLAEVRASALNDLCAAFVKHKELAGLDDSQEVTVFEATDALFHCAEQLDTQLRKGAAHHCSHCGGIDTCSECGCTATDQMLEQYRASKGAAL
ncbi:hypothetical protein OGX92_22150 [Citrobacter sp. Cpo089]|uniref:hypothetical protein n=1 Tax=Citrobacter sp. Cpo089 TaxID=2985138 RepID=UPI002578EB62|nr:hypothetical protein [Citrobacter sp. Cpo089]MDM2828060.1 hypothetical protein [Citrobacter sp. Cpo089]